MKCLAQAILVGSVFCVWAESASPSGFQLLEQNSSGLGNAYAGSAAIADNASTVFFNPAGMTMLPGKNVSAGVTIISPSYKFSNGASNVGALGRSGNGNDGGTIGYLPNTYFSTPLGTNLFVGLGIGAPFGLKTQYDSPWIGAAQSIKFKIETLNINPSVAYRVTENVSLGFGLDWQKMSADYTRMVGILAAPLPMNISTVTLKADDTGWGWNAGLLWQLSQATRVGASYRSSVKFNVGGNVTVGSPSAILRGTSGNATADITLPDTLILSVVQTIDDRWQMLGDLSRTGWSSVDQVNVMKEGAAAPIQVLDTHFRDTWRVAIGATYTYSDSWKIKSGIAYDQTPVRDAEHRLVSLPDNNRAWISVGAQWKQNKESALDFGVAYLVIRDAPINNNQTAPSSSLFSGLVNGTFKDSAWMFGAQYSLQF